MLFVEALRKYSLESKVADFSEAYKLALPIFKGRLEQTFIVLKDAKDDNEAELGAGPSVVTGSNQVPVGIKRAAQGDLGESQGSKRAAN